MSHARFLVGDVFDRLAEIPDGSVDLVMTSPPFLALRSYLPADHPDKGKEIGSEPSPAVFLDTLLALTAEWRRVLAPHGSICVELGDTYSGSGGAGGNYNPGGRGWPLDKCLAGIPHLYHLSLAYGRNLLTGEPSPAGQWRVRNVVAWCRPNPPVGALGDKFRPATSYLTVACVGRSRYFDLDAVRTPSDSRPQRRYSVEWGQRGGDERAVKYGDNYLSDELTQFGNPAGVPPLDWWSVPTDPGPMSDPESAVQYLLGIIDELTDANDGTPPDWWEIPTQPYAGSHYATWPEALLTRPIQAMCPQKVCRVCGKPSERITSVEYGELTGKMMPIRGDSRGRNQPNPVTTEADRVYRGETLGWSDCSHDNWRRGLVLDPFAGSGTTLAVAVGHGRDAVGIDLDARNADLARERVGMFLTVEGEPSDPGPPHDHNPTGAPRFRAGYKRTNDPETYGGDRSDYGSPAPSPYLSERPVVDVPTSEEVA